MTETRKNEHPSSAVNLNDLEEHGVTIPAPTPTGINVPNPWQPMADGSGGGEGPGPQGSTPTADTPGGSSSK